MRVERGIKEWGLMVGWCGVSVMAWSSTTVDDSHMHLSLMCVRGSHLCASKPVSSCKVSKVFWCLDGLSTQGTVQGVEFGHFLMLRAGFMSTISSLPTHTLVRLSHFCRNYPTPNTHSDISTTNMA